MQFLHNIAVLPNDMYDPGETLLENDQPDVPSKWLDFQVFLDKDYKPEVPSHHPKITVKVPGVVVWHHSLCSGATSAG